ncbi:MAG: hypothetical protein HRU50_03715 [Winogradskyella sp.]|uniref:hypothetical protein n=1 Tax=Winogradskyella sp. TaxID=1883156 RepID=UPI0025DF0C42|nr:hypothetical protein [Winogradskyella sp.]NRB59034.1 hypothetical protein [Winogradskyella sp.]
MLTFISKSYQIFWIVAGFLVISSIVLSNYDFTFDINVHDTYFVIHYAHLLLFLAIIYAAYGVIYCVIKMLKLELLKLVRRFHMITTVLIVPLDYSIRLLIDYFTTPSWPLSDNSGLKDIITMVLIALFLFAQLVFIIDLIFALFRKYIIKT